MNPGQWAARYAASGLPVLPLHSIRDDGRCTCGRADCHSPGKHPLNRDGKDGATVDLEQVTAWWSRWPGANIGLRPPAGVVVLDVDPRHHGATALLALTEQHARLPQMLTARTGSGGLHVWLAYSGRSRGQLCAGVDVKTNAGYLVAPPSLHVSGRRYEWITGLPTARAPRWVRRLLAPPAQPVTIPRQPTGGRIDGLVRYVADAPDGYLNIRLFWAAAVTRYCVLPSEHAVVAVVLWIAATYFVRVFEHAPRLAITSPEKRCGKSRLLEVVRALCYQPLVSVNATIAAVFRSIDPDDPPTLIVDEADAIFGTKQAADTHEDFRALLNAGHSTGWPMRRCIGPRQEPTDFSTFAMAAIAAIGKLPDTITDRAVNITMRRRAPGETVSPYRKRRDEQDLIDLADQLADRYRDRHSSSGAKSDAGDAHALADMMRTDAHQLRPVAGDSALVESIKVTARAHQNLIWDRQRQMLRLRAALREYFPVALEAFDDLSGADALELLEAAPDPIAPAGSHERRSPRPCGGPAATTSPPMPSASRRRCAASSSPSRPSSSPATRPVCRPPSRSSGPSTPRSPPCSGR